MSAIAELKAMLGLDSTAFKAGVKQAQASASKLQSTISSVGRAIGVAFSADLIIRAAGSVIEYASRASDAAEQTGLLTAEVLALNQVAARSGIDGDVLVRIVGKLKADVYQAAMGSKEAEKKFSELGLSWRELSRLDPAKQLEAIARAAVNSGMPLEQLSELFGEKLGPKAVNALKKIADKGLADVTGALGQQAEQLKVIGDEWENIKSKAKEYGIVAIASLAKGLKVLPEGLKTLINPDKAIAESKANLEAELNRAETNAKAAASGKEDSPFAGPALSPVEAAGVKAAWDKKNQKEFEKEAKARKDSAEFHKRWQEAEDRKQEAINRRKDQGEEAKQRLRDSLTDRIAATKGEGLNADAMARMGGFTGPQRAGLGAADRAAKVQEEIKKANQEMTKLTDSIAKDVAEIRNRGGDGV